MNICTIAYAPYEYDSRQVSYAGALAEAGHTVDVIAPRSKIREEFGAPRGVKVVQVSSREPGEGSVALYLCKVLWFFLGAAVVVTLRDLKRHYDVVHIHSLPDILVFAALLPRLRGAKVILDIHDLLPEFYISKFGKTRKSFSYRLLLCLEKLSARFAHHVIAANDLWRAKLVARAVPETKCSTILNYPDRALFRRRGRARNDHRTIILYPGSLNQHQGLDIAIRAFHRISGEVPGAEFHIYGTGPEKERLTKLAAERGLAARVKFYGPQPLEAMPNLLQGADVGVVPKRNDAFGDEAFSTKILEFMAMGVPVVVADTTIDRHYFDDSLVKFFRAGDETSLAEALLAVIRDQKLRASLVNNASKYVAARDWRDYRLKYLDLVARLAGGSVALKDPVADPRA